MGIDDDGLRQGSTPADPARRRVARTLVGVVVANRYRIERLVSAGAYTVVVDAVDVQVGRSVTLKLIRPEISELPEFQRRFDQVMRSMSTLSHMNISVIHDWGEDRVGGRTTMFAVVEYLGAGSLRDLFDRGRYLAPSQALVIGLDACRALDHAHRRNLVHGELTPSKLVFGDDRRLRVIDFGLARLLGASSWHEPATVETHVARYASPEQALGQPIDEKTDVYALALTLIEAVTGTVPFSADSTVATLSARVGKLTPVSADLGALASVLERAARPDRGQRWSAAEFGRALVRAAEKLPRPEPLPFVTSSALAQEPTRRPSDPTGDMHRPTPAARTAPTVGTDGGDESSATEPDDPEPASESPAIAPEGDQRPTEPVAIVPPPEPAWYSEPQPEQKNDAAAKTKPAWLPPPAAPGDTPTLQGSAVPPSDSDQDVLHDEPAHAAETQVAPTTGNPAATTAHYDTVVPPSASSASTSRRLWLKALVAFLLLAALGGLVLVGYLLLRTERHEVPALAGMTEEAAASAVDEFDWDVQTRLERSDEEPDAGDVIRTSPATGEQLAEGEPFFLIVSEGPEFRELPDMRGARGAEAREQLRELRLEASTTDPVYDEEIPPGAVVSWVVAGDEAKRAGDGVLPGTEIELTLSRGPEPRSVPDLRSLSIAQASEQLDELGLMLEQGEAQFSNEVDRDLIIRQSPRPGGELERGETVTIRVSKGPDFVVFPQLEGLNFRRAVAALERAGYVRGGVLGSTKGTFQRARIDGEIADAGDQYVRGTRVDLIFF
ncbi:MAG: PASTA domain-containing protein [Actinomycetota bacterium]|nr:PASTA domain-containing protein [Actinomycetota bacterium]